MRWSRKSAARALCAGAAVMSAWFGLAAAGAEGDASTEARLARIGESLAQGAYDALSAAAWGDGVSPTLVMPPGLAEEIDPPTAIALLTRGQSERAKGAWEALRIGRGRLDAGGAGAGGAGTRAPGARAIGAPLAYPSTDVDLERACRLLVCEALVASIPAETRVPADLVRDLLVHAPLPTTNPSADPALARCVQRLERAGRLSRTSRLEADRVVAEFGEVRVHADQWKARHDALLSRAAMLADGEEGRALVAVARRVHAARAGWSSVSEKGESARGARPTDEVARSIRKAVADGQACFALAEMLVALEPVRTARIDSLAVSGEGRLRVGRSVATISQDSIDAWRRACGLQRSAVGWTGLSARPRPRPPKIRDAPFGIKPL